MKKILKNMEKLFILILGVLACVMPTVDVLAASDTILDSFKATFKTIDTPISFPTNFHVIKTTDGKHVYCMQYNLKVPASNITYTKGSLITDSGLNYILNQAYGKTSDNDHFVYKSAFWLYMIDKGLMPGTNNNLKTYYENVKKSNTAEAKKILALIDSAKKASANDTTAPVLTLSKTTGGFKLSEDGKYYVSDTITVNTKEKAYDVELTSAPKGSSVSRAGYTFTVKVPVSSVTSLNTKVTYKVKTSKDIYTSYKYNPSNTAYQPLAVTYKENKVVSATGEFNLSNKASVAFLKVDAKTGAAIAGAELELTNSKGEKVDSWISEEKEKVISLGEGSYVLTEKKAPSGYKMIEKSIKFSVDGNGNILDANGKKIVKIVISNEKITYSVPFLKIDAKTGEAISGAELRLTDSNGKEVKTWVSEREEEVIHGLLPGKYTLTEVKAPAGYNALKTSIEFTIDNNGKIINSNNETVKIIKVENEKKTGGVLISKRDITNDEELPGATLQIKDFNGNTKDEWTWVSTNEAHYIEALEPGVYTLREIYAPDGYVLSDEVITFTVKVDGKVETVVMYNSPSSKDEVPVEPTSSFKTMTPTIIGSVVLMIGSFIIIRGFKKKEN